MGKNVTTNTARDKRITVVVNSKYTSIPVDDTKHKDNITIMISGLANIDDVEEYRHWNTNGKLIDGLSYKYPSTLSFISKVVITIALNKKYKRRDCIIYYRYEFHNFIAKPGDKFIVTITDGKNHPKVRFNNKTAIEFKISDLKYTGRRSCWRNFVKTWFTGLNVYYKEITP